MTGPTDDKLEAMAAKLDAIHIVTGVRANRDILGTRPIEAANDAQREAAAILRACKTGDAPTDERVKRLEAENARLRNELADALTAIEECRDEIDQSIWNEYPHDHPVQERYRQRDFSANPARVFLERRAALRDMGVE